MFRALCESEKIVEVGDESELLVLLCIKSGDLDSDFLDRYFLAQQYQ